MRLEGSVFVFSIRTGGPFFDDLVVLVKDLDLRSGNLRTCDVLFGDGDLGSFLFAVSDDDPAVFYNNFTIGLCGDLKFGRTVHSLINALTRYEGINFIFISPQELRVPDYITEMLNSKNIPYREVIKLEDVIADLDFLYMTRVQKERFFNEEDYIRLKDFYILDKKKLDMAKSTMQVLHPLPRVNEISVEVDDDPRAAYFKQVQYGLYVRMALILTLLNMTDAHINDGLLRKF
jgi:aspartate carbamoyltransferase catalytic subunit